MPLVKCRLQVGRERYIRWCLCRRRFGEVGKVAKGGLGEMGRPEAVVFCMRLREQIILPIAKIYLGTLETLSLRDGSTDEPSSNHLLVGTFIMPNSIFALNAGFG